MIQSTNYKSASYDNFPLFTEVKRKKTENTVFCLDRIWWKEENKMIFSLSLNYKPFYHGTRGEAELVFASFKETT
jgi:hypothetical protein